MNAMTIPTEAEARDEVVGELTQYLPSSEPYPHSFDAALDRYRDVILANQPCYYEFEGAEACIEYEGRSGSDAARCPTCEARRRLEG